jgi:hypothetical protein
MRRDLINQAKHQKLFDSIKKLPELLNSYSKSIGSKPVTNDYKRC